MKFVRLTRPQGQPLYFNINRFVSVKGDAGSTIINLSGGVEETVVEPVGAVVKVVDEADNKGGDAIYYWEEGPDRVRTKNVNQIDDDN